MDAVRKRKETARRQRAESIGEGKNKAIIDKGRAINDGKNMKRKMEAQKRSRAK